MPKINLDQVADIIREVSRETIMPRHGALQPHEIWNKNTSGVGKPDYVTIADRESEVALTKRLQDYLPNSLVVGEEAAAADPSIIARFDSDEPVWVIDPIDGTRNFVEGKPEFAVMCALVQNHRPIASWIHHPLSDDTIMAEQGAGVFLRGRKLKLAFDHLTPSIPGLAGSRIRKLIGNGPILPAGQGTPPIEIGSCAGFDYPRLFVDAGGEALAFADATTPRVGFLIYHRTKPWDHLPGMLMHHEAGGHSADWSGKAYSAHDTKAGLLYAPHAADWDRLQGLFRPIIDMASRKSA